MFYYWDGFEIDGSDTDFDIVLPEVQQRIDFVKSFLSMPILLPWICTDEASCNNEYAKEVTREDALKKVEQGETLTLFVNCGLIEQFPKAVQDKNYL